MVGRGLWRCVFEDGGVGFVWVGEGGVERVDWVLKKGFLTFAFVCLVSFLSFLLLLMEMSLVVDGDDAFGCFFRMRVFIL
jgi:hypothetical protein